MLFSLNKVTLIEIKGKWHWMKNTFTSFKYKMYFVQQSKIYFFLDTPTVLPLLPVVLVCWPRTLKLEKNITHKFKYIYNNLVCQQKLHAWNNITSACILCRRRVMSQLWLLRRVRWRTGIKLVITISATIFNLLHVET